MGRAPCCDKANVKRGPWSPEEDAMLKNFVEKYGTGGNWIALPRKAGLKRCGKSCRLRWLNYLRPDIKHGGFSEEEDNIICRLYANIGSRWSIIAAQLPGRTDNDIKNYWNTKLKKKILAKTSTSHNNNKDDNERHQIISNSHQNLMVSSSNKRQQDLLGMPEMRSSSDPQQNQNVNRSSASHMPVSSFSHPNHHLSGSSTDSKSLNSTQIYEDQQQHNTHTQIQIFQESGRKMQQPDQYPSFTSMLMRFQPQKTEDSSDCSTNLAPPIMANSNASASAAAAALNAQDHQLYMAMNQSTVKQEPGVENGNNHNHHGILVPMIAPYWDTAAAGNYQSLLMEAMADAANNNGSSGSNLALSYVLSEDHASSYNNSSTAEEAPRFCTYLQLPVSATTATTTTTTDNSNAFGSSSAYVPSAGASSSNLSFRHHSSYQYIMAGEAATTTTTAPTTTTNKQVLFQNEFRPSLENNVFCA